MRTANAARFVAGALAALTMTCVLAQAQDANVPAPFVTPDRVETRLGTLNFKDGIPDPATTQK
ncbi:MAG: hypothetical protein ACHQ1G_02740, partial [Planctomycetota bacterium]